MIAASAARATCGTCGRQVRGGVELAADLAALREEFAAARRQCDGGVSDALLHAIAEQLATLSAELTGVHRTCSSVH